jgi:hypothetical protein
LAKWLDKRSLEEAGASSEVNWDKFGQWLIRRWPMDETRTIAVVSHSHFLKALFKQLKLPWKQIWNSSIFKVGFVVSNGKLVLDPKAPPPEKIWTGFQPKEKWEPRFAERCEMNCKNLVQSCGKKDSKQEPEEAAPRGK